MENVIEFFEQQEQLFAAICKNDKCPNFEVPAMVPALNINAVPSTICGPCGVAITDFE